MSIPTLLYNNIFITLLLSLVYCYADPDNAAKQNEQKKRFFEDKNKTNSFIFLYAFFLCFTVRVMAEGLDTLKISCHHELCIKLVLTNIIAGEN